MVNLTINGQKISVSEGTTILEAALKVGIDIPHLCYLKDINEIGACRVCVVENAGMETLVTACNTPVEEGMELYTAVKRHLIKSLSRLQTDYVDLYYLHRVTDKVPVEAVAEVMGRLIKEGLIRGWGLSQVSVDVLKQADQITPVSAVQNLYNILERDCEDDIFPYCMEHGIGVVPFSPIASGLLSGKITVGTEFEKVDDVRNWVPQLTKENIAGNQPILDIIQEYAEKKDATNAQISLAWMLHKYPNVVPIPGSKNKERILENLGADKVSFTDEEFTALETALAGCKIYGHRGHVEMEGKGFLNKKPLR